ncbi:MAG: hypothetical protein WC821_04535 [archaeon]|jgi:hypothetical protein
MITGYVSGAAKKALSLDKDYLIVMVLFLLVLFSAKAFAIVEAPTQVMVDDKTIFYVDISNDSDKIVNLSVNFFAPIKSEVVVQKTIAPREKATAKITLYNTKYDSKTKINAIVEANMGDTIEQKEIVLSFSGKQFNQNGPLNAMFTSFFSLSSFVSETTNYSLADWAIFWVLIIISAVLLIAFVSRVKNRV